MPAAVFRESLVVARCSDCERADGSAWASEALPLGQAMKAARFHNETMHGRRRRCASCGARKLLKPYGFDRAGDPVLRCHQCRTKRQQSKGFDVAVAVRIGRGPIVPLAIKDLEGLFTRARLDILTRLRDRGPFASVKALAGDLGRSDGDVSRDLRSLSVLGFVETARDGRRVGVRLASSSTSSFAGVP